VAKKPKGSTPATVLLQRLGLAFTPHEYAHDPAAPSYGLEAAQVLGVEPGRVFKTLLATVDGQLTVAVVPVSSTLDLKALAAARRAKRAAMAGPAEAERSSGYVVGGISPIGQRRALPTVVDDSAWSHDTVYVSGGRRGFDIELSPDALAAATSAVAATIARRS
jgi:Cys-tRNA(Pro)/Cys-tRNA(Cys) deacylase